MIGQWILITTGAVVISAAIAVLIGRARETAQAEQMAAALIESAGRRTGPSILAPSPNSRPRLPVFSGTF